MCRNYCCISPEGSQMPPISDVRITYPPMIAASLKSSLPTEDDEETLSYVSYVGGLGGGVSDNRSRGRSRQQKRPLLDAPKASVGWKPDRGVDQGRAAALTPTDVLSPRTDVNAGVRLRTPEPGVPLLVLGATSPAATFTERGQRQNYCHSKTFFPPSCCRPSAPQMRSEPLSGVNARALSHPDPKRPPTTEDSG